MKKTFLIAGVLFSVAAMSAGLLLTQKSIAEQLVPWWINRQNTEFSVSTLTIGSQTYRFPDNVRFEDVRVTVREQDRVFTVAVGTVDIRHMANAVQGIMPVVLDLVRFEVDAQDLSIREGLVQIAISPSRDGMEKVDGHVRISSVRQGKFLLTGVSADITGNLSTWRFDNLYSSFGNGQVQGQILLDSKNQMVYDVQLVVKNIGLDHLRPVNPDIFSKVSGIVDGTAEVKGTPTGILSIDAQFSADNGGEVKASLLQYLVPYIPANSMQRKDLEKLIEADGDVPLTRAEVEIKNLTDELLSSRIRLESERFNLDVDVTLDVRVDGGFQNLLTYQQKFTNYLGGSQ